MAISQANNLGISMFPGEPLPQTTGERPDIIGWQSQAQGNTDPWANIFEAVRKISALADNWDGLGAEAPSPAVQSSAVEFAHALRRCGYAAPSSVVASPDGTVLFMWRGEFFYRDAEITEPHHAEWMQIIPGQSPTHWREWVPAVPSQAALKWIPEYPATLSLEGQTPAGSVTVSVNQIPTTPCLSPTF